jgi:hypothetical protein
VSPRPNQQSREHPSRSGLLNQVGLQGYNVKTNDLSRCGLRVKFTWSLSQVTAQASSPRLHCRTTLTTPCTTTIISRHGAGRNIIMITNHKSRWPVQILTRRDLEKFFLIIDMSLTSPNSPTDLASTHNLWVGLEVWVQVESRNDLQQGSLPPTRPTYVVVNINFLLGLNSKSPWDLSRSTQRIDRVNNSREARHLIMDADWGLVDDIWGQPV